MENKLTSGEKATNEQIHQNSNNQVFPRIVDSRHVGIIYTRETRWLIFLVLMTTNLFVNMDHGTIPAATTEIKIDLQIEDDSLGVFGSLVYLGNLIGSMFFFTIIGTFNRKWITVTCMLLTCASLYTFTNFKILYLLFINRIVTGFFQAFLTIYFPVWCDQFGPRKHKAIMMALLQLGVPLGVVCGYILTSQIKAWLGWRFSFYIQLCLVGIFAIILSFCPQMYFSGKHYLDKQIEIKSSKISERKYSVQDNVSLFKENLRLSAQRKTICGNMKQICGNYVFLFSVLSVGILFFIITAIQFWVTDYLTNIRKFNENIVTISFIITCVTSPTMGILVGGCFFNWLGGPETKFSSTYVLILGILAFLSALPVPFMDDILIFSIFLWLVLFFGGCLMPNITGIIISSLPPNIRSQGNSLSNFFQNLIGYLPAPFVYGMISRYFPNYQRLPMIVTMYTSFIGVIFMTLAAIYKCKTFSNDQFKRSLIDKKKTMINNMNAKASLIAILWGNKDLEFNQLEDKPVFETQKENDEADSSTDSIQKAENAGESVKFEINNEGNKEEIIRTLFSSSFIEKRCDLKKGNDSNEFDPKTF